jgi:hypothetical protein
MVELVMAGRAVRRPGSVSVLSVAAVSDPATQRALEQTQDAVQNLQATPKRVVVQADLVVGTNIVPHGLGRRANGYTLTPTVANATFAHAIDDENPDPDREIWVTVIGVAQPGARIEVW